MGPNLLILAGLSLISVQSGWAMPNLGLDDKTEENSLLLEVI